MDASALLLSVLFPPVVGGTPVLFESVYSRLAQDLPVTVLTDEAPPGAAAAAHGALTIVRHPIKTPHWGVFNMPGIRTYAQIVRHIRKLTRGGRAVVHCGRALPEGVAAWLNRRAGGSPYVCWAHGEDIVSARSSREFTMLMRAVFRGATNVIANSANTARMAEAVGTPPDRIRIVYPGVDSHRFHPDVDGRGIRSRLGDDRAAVLLSVGRLQRRKGHDLVIEAMAQLVPTRRIHYLIVGDGEERPRLEALTAAHALGHCVHFLGEVPVDDLPRYFAACDVFVMPNRIDTDGDVEGFGIVFLEAAASGRPTIGGRSGGVPEALVDGRTGVLVSGTDAGELAAAIGDLLSSDAKRAAMGAAGRERACRDFTWDRAAIDVLAVHRAAAAARWPAR